MKQTAYAAGIEAYCLCRRNCPSDSAALFDPDRIRWANKADRIRVGIRKTGIRKQKSAAKHMICTKQCAGSESIVNRRNWT